MRLMNNALKLLANIFLPFLFGSLIACAPKGFVSARIAEPDAAIAPHNTATPVEIEALKTTKTADDKDVPNAVELLWQIPTQPVDGFVIKLGYSRDHLDKELRVNTPDLERFEDPKHGYVYRYVLHEIPRTHPLYVSMSAFRGEVVSPASEIFELQAVGEVVE